MRVQLSGDGLVGGLVQLNVNSGSIQAASILVTLLDVPGPGPVPAKLIQGVIDCSAHHVTFRSVAKEISQNRFILSYYPLYTGEYSISLSLGSIPLLSAAVIVHWRFDLPHFPLLSSSLHSLAQLQEGNAVGVLARQVVFRDTLLRDIRCTLAGASEAHTHAVLVLRERARDKFAAQRDHLRALKFALERERTLGRLNSNSAGEAGEVSVIPSDDYSRKAWIHQAHNKFTAQRNRLLKLHTQFQNVQKDYSSKMVEFGRKARAKFAAQAAKLYSLKQRLDSAEQSSQERFSVPPLPNPEISSESVKTQAKKKFDAQRNHLLLLASRIETVERERATLSSLVVDLEKKRKDAEHTNSSSNLELTRLRDSLVHDLGVERKRCETLSMRVAALEVENSREKEVLLSRCSELEKSRSETSTALTLARQENEELRARIAALERSCDSANASARDFALKLSTTQNALTRAKTRAESKFKAQHRRLMSLASSIQNSRSEVIAKLEETANNLVEGVARSSEMAALKVSQAETVLRNELFEKHHSELVALRVSHERALANSVRTCEEYLEKERVVSEKAVSDVRESCSQELALYRENLANFKRRAHSKFVSQRARIIAVVKSLADLQETCFTFNRDIKLRSKEKFRSQYSRLVGLAAAISDGLKRHGLSEARVDELTSVLRTSESEIISLRTILEDVRAESDAAIARSHRELEALRSLNVALEERAAVAEHSLDEIRVSTLASVSTNELVLLRNALEELQIERSSESAIHSKTIDAMRLEILSKESELKRANEQSLTVERELRDAVSERDAALAIAAERERLLTEALVNSQAANAPSSEDSNAKLQHGITEVQELQVDDAVQSANLLADSSELNSEIAALRSHCETLTTALAERDSEFVRRDESGRIALDTAYSELTSLKNSLETLKVDLASREDTIGFLHSQLDASTLALAERDEEVQQLRARLEQSSPYFQANSLASEAEAQPSSDPVVENAVASLRTELNSRIEACKELETLVKDLRLEMDTSTRDLRATLDARTLELQILQDAVQKAPRDQSLVRQNNDLAVSDQALSQQLQSLREERAALLEQVNEQGVKLEKLLKERSDWATYYSSREVSLDAVVDVLRSEKKELSALLFAKMRALEALLQDHKRLILSMSEPNPSSVSPREQSSATNSSATHSSSSSSPSQNAAAISQPSSSDSTTNSASPEDGKPTSTSSGSWFGWKW